jgi:hypothetical protein
MAAAAALLLVLILVQMLRNFSVLMVDKLFFL